MNYQVLIIDDEKDIRNLLSRTFELEGYEVVSADTIRKGLGILSQKEVHVVVLDVKLPDGSGIDATREIKQSFPEVEIVCLTAYGNIPDGVQAIKNGAFDYLVKGDDNIKVIPLVEKALEKALLQYRVKHLQERIMANQGLTRINGKSPAIREAVQLAKKVGPTDATVLLTGATGTGKEIFAHAIHRESKRRDESFVAVNCSAFSKELLESEMFGHKAGAFTGAVKDKKGLFEEAHRGTIFLDEIGEMNLDLQAKILRVIENGSFLRVGESRQTNVNVRIIAATNRDLEQEMEEGKFREDLFYRLSVFKIELPSLDERKEDIPELAESLIHQLSIKMNKKIAGMSDDFVKALIQHSWKGNIRELRNVLERSIILSDKNILTSDLLPFDFLLQKTSVKSGGVYTIKELERQHIKNMLVYTRGNKTKAAKLLDIGLTTLYGKLKEYQIYDK